MNNPSLPTQTIAPGAYSFPWRSTPHCNIDVLNSHARDDRSAFSSARKKVCQLDLRSVPSHDSLIAPSVRPQLSVGPHESALAGFPRPRAFIPTNASGGTRGHASLRWLPANPRVIPSSRRRAGGTTTLPVEWSLPHARSHSKLSCAAGNRVSSSGGGRSLVEHPPE